MALLTITTSQFRTLSALTPADRTDYLARRLHRRPTIAEISAFERSFNRAVLHHNAAVAASRRQPT